MSEMKFGDILIKKVGKWMYTGKFIGMHDIPVKIIPREVGPGIFRGSMKIGPKKEAFIQPLRAHICSTNKYDHKELERQRNRKALGLHEHKS